MRIALATVAILCLALTGCPDPLEDCEWGTPHPGPYQSIRDDGGCLATNLDTSAPLNLVEEVTFPIVATGEVGDDVAVIPTRFGGENFPAILTPATNDRPGFFCNFVEGPEMGEACAAVELRCGTHADTDIPIALGSVRVDVIVNGETVADLYIRPEPTR